MISINDRLAAALADRYRIERELGAGGRATVYLAEDVKHKRRVALKVMRGELAAGLGSDRFLREIRLAASLHHPNILPLYDSGEADQLATHPLRGAVFETWVASEVLKQAVHRGERPNLFHYRDATGLEVDLVSEGAAGVVLAEAKSGATVASDFSASVERLA